MLRHLGLGCILFICRPSIIPLRSIHHVPSSGWVMLNKQGIRTDDTFVADAKTVACARTSTGHHLRVSFQGVPPPASSFIHYDFPDSLPGDEEDDSDTDEGEEDDDDTEEDEEYDIDDLCISVVATHGDSVLLKMSHRRLLCDFEDDHFMYRAGGTTSPPTISLLPERDFLTKAEQVYADRVSPPIRPKLHSRRTCLLHRGDGDVLLAELDSLYDSSSRRYMVEFCLLRHGSLEWELKEPVPIIWDQEGGKGIEQLQRRSGIDTIIPLGDQLLCWVTYETGFLLCDMGDAAASPKVRYVPLPPGVCWDPVEYQRDMSVKHSMNMGAAGARAVRFVSVDPHCCCGGLGKTTCAHSRYAFTINTWTMKNLGMDDKPLTWVKDGEIDCEELWGLPGYEGLPRANLMCPIVSLEDPSVVCFLVSNDRLVSSYEDLKLWMIQLNINTKTLLSSVQYTNDKWGAYCHLPATLQ